MAESVAEQTLRSLATSQMHRHEGRRRSSFYSSALAAEDLETLERQINESFVELNVTAGVDHSPLPPVVITFSKNVDAFTLSMNGSVAIGIDAIQLTAMRSVVNVLLALPESSLLRRAFLRKLHTVGSIMFHEGWALEKRGLLVNIYRISEALAVSAFHTRSSRTTLGMMDAWTEFALAHELAHVHLGHIGKAKSQLSRLKPKLEKEADAWAFDRLRTSARQRDFQRRRFQSLMDAWEADKKTFPECWIRYQLLSVRLFLIGLHLMSNVDQVDPVSVGGEVLRSHPLPLVRERAVPRLSEGPVPDAFRLVQSRLRAAADFGMELAVSQEWQQICQSKTGERQE